MIRHKVGASPMQQLDALIKQCKDEERAQNERFEVERAANTRLLQNSSRRIMHSEWNDLGLRLARVDMNLGREVLCNNPYNVVPPKPSELSLQAFDEALKAHIARSSATKKQS